MRVLLITPPMTQINTPYPATAYLSGFLRGRGYSQVFQADLSLELFLMLFSSGGVREMESELEAKLAAGRLSISPTIEGFLAGWERYAGVVGPVVRFLQGKDPSIAHRLVSEDFLPRGARFAALEQWSRISDSESDPIGWAFGQMGVQDRAQYLASLFVDDLADVIREGIDPKFELSRYAEKLASSAPSFDPLRECLEGPSTLVDRYVDALAEKAVERYRPDVVGLTVPFPGNVYGALRIARAVRRLSLDVAIVLGGGYVNTELRDLSDDRVFDYVDYVTLDDGEMPFLAILESLNSQKQRIRVPAASDKLLRTYVRRDGVVKHISHPTLHDIPLKDCGTPSYEGLALSDYVSLCEMLNPMHRLWSDGRWNKLTLAHGCYWKKCSFCDTSLDYIGRYEPQSAVLVVDRMEKMMAETGCSGFHFVDEAAPPKLLSALAKEILRRGLVVSWWGNIRFEKTFTQELTALLAKSGCVAVTGGLEVASDRLLALMEKGVTVEQVAQVTRAFADAGVLVHAYLMYGFPSQTVAETVESLERVRQLFAAGCIQSAFWHRFSVTVHSPVGKNPSKYGIQLLDSPSTFARNDLSFVDSVRVDHDALSVGLKKALYNYMLGIGLDEDVRAWFDFRVPKPKVPKRLISSALGQGRSLRQDIW